MRKLRTMLIVGWSAVGLLWWAFALFQWLVRDDAASAWAYAAIGACSVAFGIGLPMLLRKGERDAHHWPSHPKPPKADG